VDLSNPLSKKGEEEITMNSTEWKTWEVFVSVGREKKKKKKEGGGGAMIRVGRGTSR